MIARVHAMRTEMDQAKAAFAKARELDPLLSDATVEHAELIDRFGDTAEAKLLLEAQLAEIRDSKAAAAPPARAAFHISLARLARDGTQIGEGQ